MSTLQNPSASHPPQVQASAREEASGVELIGGGFFVDGFLAQVIAAFVLLLHAIKQQQNQENGKQDAHAAAHNQSCREQREQQGESCSLGRGGSYPPSSSQMVRLQLDTLTITTACAQHADDLFDSHNLTYEKGSLEVPEDHRTTVAKPPCQPTFAWVQSQALSKRQLSPS